MHDNYRLRVHANSLIYVHILVFQCKFFYFGVNSFLSVQIILFQCRFSYLCYSVFGKRVLFMMIVLTLIQTLVHSILRSRIALPKMRIFFASSRFFIEQDSIRVTFTELESDYFILSRRGGTQTKLNF